jgi:hypothetical protein
MSRTPSFVFQPDAYTKIGGSDSKVMNGFGSRQKFSASVVEQECFYEWNRISTEQKGQELSTQPLNILCSLPKDFKQ